MIETRPAFADAVIVAAGSSRRMDGTDKLLAELDGRPVLGWAVESMTAVRSVAEVLVVVAPERVGSICSAAGLDPARVRVMGGGERRQDSVAAGVRAARSAVVLVHDAARPFVAPDVVDEVARMAARDGAAIPVLPVVDSLKLVEGQRVVAAAPRDGVYRAQTPQGARRELLLAAVEAHAGTSETFGDEAELLARYGVPVTTVPGDPANIKLTLPSDLELARSLVAARRTPVRSGSGWDSHPFGPLDGLRLGGIEVPEAPRLHGHSDGDVALHALCDALLGAAGMGDIGSHFPAGDPATRGIDSRALVGAVVERLASAGWRPASVDLTILGARPRLGQARLERMRDGIAELLGLARDDVSIKAASGNLDGAEGAGRSISATCLASVGRP